MFHTLAEFIAGHMQQELNWHVWPMNTYLPLHFAMLPGHLLSRPFEKNDVNTCFINAQGLPRSDIDFLLDEQWKCGEGKGIGREY